MQILGIGVICGKQTEDFKSFLNDVRNMTKQSIRVFITDRLKAQQNAIEAIFPESHIVFCKIHIRRNIAQSLGKNSKVLSLFDDFMKFRMSREDYIGFLKGQKALNPKQQQHIQNLIDDLDHYDPNVTGPLNLRNHNTSNGAEGMFSNLKSWTEHQILPLHEVINHLYRQMIMLMKANYRNSNKKSELGEHIYSGKPLGLFAIEEIRKSHTEMTKLMSHAMLEGTASHVVHEKLNACKCMKQIVNKLPCVHDLFNAFINTNGTGPLLTENDIPDIYFLQELVPRPINEPSIINISKQSLAGITYNSLMEEMMPWISAATHDPRIMQQFNEFFDKMEQFKVIIDPGAGKALTSPGAPMRYPSALVDHKKPGQRKRKRIIFCSNCGNPGHNRSSCTLPPKTEEEVFIEKMKKNGAKQMSNLNKR